MEWLRLGSASLLTDCNDPTIIESPTLQTSNRVYHLPDLPVIRQQLFGDYQLSRLFAVR